jgi:hypothetical protein
MKKISVRTFLPALSFFFGCTTTHVQWDAVRMREQVVEYYNDEVMDNLIRAVNGQPFVHVDVASLQAIAGSKLSGTANAGQTETHTTGTSPGMTVPEVVETFSRVVMRPFGFSVTPERSDTLTIASTPVIGAVAPPSTGRPPPNIYELYLQFLNLNPSSKELCKSKTDLSYLSSSGECNSVRKVCTLKERQSLPPYVPGTLKSRGNCLYYIPICYQTQYLELFRALLTAKRPSGGPPPGAPAGVVPTFTL